MTPRGTAPRSRREAGIALLLAVWILALLAVIGGEFMTSGRVRSAAERNRRDDLRGLALAQAGYRAAVAALDDDEITGLSRDTDGMLLLHYRGRAEAVPAFADDVALGDGSYSWQIEDEDGLVDLNAQNLQRGLLGNLLQRCGLEPGVERDTIVDSILDWRDPNREHRLNGAEEDYYRGLDPPYSCKDGKFDVVEELLLVRGVTPKIFRGGEVDGKKVPGLRDLVTATGRIDLQVNLATAPQPVLDALGKARQEKPALSEHFVIVATGHPGGGAPPRALRAVVRRDDAGDSRSFTRVYWHDSYVTD